LHIGRAANAEKYFLNSLAIDPNLIPAHAALGMLRARQGRLPEALRNLQRAAPTSQNHLVHFFYAYALSRQGMNEEGRASIYPPETVQTIRSHLQTTIKLAPDFAEAYHLLAFVNLVTNEQLEQSIVLIKRAMSLEPGRQDLKLVLAQIYLKLRDTESGRRLLESLARQTEDQQLRSQAESLLANSSADGTRLPQFSTAAATSVVTVAQPGVGTSSTGLRIDTSGPMPTVEEVLAKYVEGLGGEGKIRKLTSRVTRGKARVPGEFNDASFEIYEKSPNKALLIVKVERGLGQGFDGSAGWRQDGPGQVRRLKGSELAEMQRDCDFYAPLRIKVNYSEVKLLGRVKIGYREAYLVEAKPATGEADKFYFETSTGMLIRSDGVRSGWRERALVEVYYDDWRAVEGIKVPFRVTRSSPHFTIAMTVDEVKYDVALDDQVFTLRGAK
jgi:Tetratricopeptide repeat